MNSNNYWEDGEWEQLMVLIQISAADYKDTFSEWLQNNPSLWHRFVSYGLEAVERNDPYGYSAVALLDVLHFDLSPDEYERAKDNFPHAGDLGRLLIAKHPETYESLWRGERYRQPTLDLASEYARHFEEEYDCKGFFIDDEPYRDAPGSWVFPELAGQPLADPVNDVGNA